jgi:hypothetical protein
LLDRVRVPSVPRRHRSYAVLRHLVAVDLGYGLPCLWSTSNACATSSRVVPCARQRTTLRGRVTGSPAAPDFFEEKRGSPRLLDRPHYTRREPNTTPDVRRSCHDDRRNCCLRGLWNLGHPVHVLFSGPPRRGSCTCMPTHRRCRRRSPSQGLLPSDPARSSRAESRIRRTTN